jgi:hypothetical protein
LDPPSALCGLRGRRDGASATRRNRLIKRHILSLRKLAEGREMTHVYAKFASRKASSMTGGSAFRSIATNVANAAPFSRRKP